MILDVEEKASPDSGGQTCRAIFQKSHVEALFRRPRGMVWVISHEKSPGAIGGPSLWVRD